MNYQGLIEASELAELLEQESGQAQEQKQGQSQGAARHLVILDCRYDLADTEAGEAAFFAGHIPGAQYASLHRDLSAPCERYGGRHPFPTASQFAEFARSAGISDDTQVVVYDDQRFAFAARAWWLLRHFGHSKVAILNGGFKAWKNAEREVEEGAACASAGGNFSPAPAADQLLHYADIYPHLDNPPWQLVDARDSKRFLGNEEPIDPIAGHIPGAINKPWQAVTDEDGFAKPRPALLEHWQSIPADDDIVCYCGSGVTACVNLFSLYLISREARLYPGSWSDWCAHILHPREMQASA
ncbi:sulfurtransferase [Microbulbifer sp. CAU 1566]|uniref:sulfurtransferase n=1 Tax=Microbulbifer sp. CAU 1566 TaxID=2933269 RepID=UPI0020052144|nr:sulfurtransferase [Microbulbifer sp. CAU 1566]MCK7596985.1 sulfurtransferase [Microbulbifer sp. CAU 1566]